jgi:hypothetical protein
MITKSSGADDQCLVYEIPEAGRLVGLNRGASYAAANRGELGTIIQFGKQKRILKVEFHRKFGLPAD